MLNINLNFKSKSNHTHLLFQKTVVQPRGRDVLPPEGGHPQGPPDQRAQHVRLRHEGQVHQAHPQEGIQVREQVRQAAEEGLQ